MSMKSSFVPTRAPEEPPARRRPLGTGHQDMPLRWAPRRAPAANPAATHITVRWSMDSIAHVVVARRSAAVVPRTPVP